MLHLRLGRLSILLSYQNWGRSLKQSKWISMRFAFTSCGYYYWSSDLKVNISPINLTCMIQNNLEPSIIQSAAFSANFLEINLSFNRFQNAPFRVSFLGRIKVKHIWKYLNSYLCTYTLACQRKSITTVDFWARDCCNHLSNLQALKHTTMCHIFIPDSMLLFNYLDPISQLDCETLQHPHAPYCETYFPKIYVKGKHPNLGF